VLTITSSSRCVKPSWSAAPDATSPNSIPPFGLVCSFELTTHSLPPEQSHCACCHVKRSFPHRRSLLASLQLHCSSRFLCAERIACSHSFLLAWSFFIHRLTRTSFNCKLSFLRAWLLCNCITHKVFTLTFKTKTSHSVILNVNSSALELRTTLQRRLHTLSISNIYHDV
jgi:hypothetical protein